MAQRRGLVVASHSPYFVVAVLVLVAGFVALEGAELVFAQPFSSFLLA